MIDYWLFKVALTRILDSILSPSYGISEQEASGSFTKK